MNRFRVDQLNACGKRKYYTEFNALMAIAKAQATNNPYRPKRKYYCDRCKAWHLSSLTEREYKAHMSNREEQIKGWRKQHWE